MFFNRHLYDHRQLSSDRLRFAGTGPAAIALAAFVCLALAAPAFPQSGLALSPMRMEMNLVPGAQRNGTLTLSNDSREPARFRTEILDLSIDREATPQFEKDIPGESQFSCRQWVTVNPMEGELGATNQTLVRYTFHVPPQVPERVYHCALGFTSLPNPGKPQGLGIVALLRVVSTFYITIGKPLPSGTVKEIAIEKINPTGTSGYRAVVSVENSGLTNLRGDGTADVLNQAGQVVESSPFPSVIILPRRVQRLPVIITKKLPDGVYSYRVRVNLGTGEIQEATYRFQIPVPEPASPPAQPASPEPAPTVAQPVPTPPDPAH